MSFSYSTFNLYQLRDTFAIAPYAGSPNKVSYADRRFLCRIKHPCKRASFYCYHKMVTPYGNILGQVKNLGHRHDPIQT